MAINPSAIASRTIADPVVPVVIEMLSTQPVAGQVFTPLRPPGQLAGFFNGAINGVELYVVNRAGNRWLRVV
jgi:hypothetical protein